MHVCVLNVSVALRGSAMLTSSGFVVVVAVVVVVVVVCFFVCLFGVVGFFVYLGLLVSLFIWGCWFLISLLLLFSLF